MGLLVTEMRVVVAKMGLVVRLVRLLVSLMGLLVGLLRLLVGLFGLFVGLFRLLVSPLGLSVPPLGSWGGVGLRGLVRVLLLLHDGLSLVAHLSHEARLAVHVVCDGLEATVRQQDGVGTLGQVSLAGLLAGEVRTCLVVLNNKVEVVSGLLRVFRCLESRSYQYWG